MAEKGAKKTITEAQDKAAKILEMAQERALEILNKSRIDLENRNDKLETRLDKIEEKEVTDFRKSLEQVTTDLRGEASVVVGQRVDEEFAKAREEIKGYKEMREKEIDGKVDQILKQVVYEVVGKTLNNDDHRELILKSLEEAKKQHVF